MHDHRVLVIGGGIAGLAAARTLALFEVHVDLVERRADLGGHAAQFACKATDRCVKCGACLVTEALTAATSNPYITIHTESRVGGLRPASGHFDVTIDREQPGSPGGDPPSGTGQGAIPSITVAADAVVLAAGFDVFDPRDKAYGYGVFPNVITNLELERRLRLQGRLTRPSDGQPPQRVAYIQCIGSRDAQLGHLWCSRFCCGAALRSARRIQALQPQTEVTVFYIDIQSVGRDFESFYRQCRQELRLIRAIPGEAFALPDEAVRLVYTEGALHPSTEAVFDLVVLSTGMVPPAGLGELADRLGMRLADSGYALRDAGTGIFAAGAVRGPMGIADSLADACDAAARVLAFLGCYRNPPERFPDPAHPPCSHRVVLPA
jgi:heterodisulfide reductase subunit A